MINNSCFNGKGALGSLVTAATKKARVVKDEDSLRWSRWTLVANQKVVLMERVHLEV